MSICFAIALFLGSTDILWAIPKAVDVRIGENSETTRFLIELSEKTSIDTHVDAQNQSVKIRFLKPIDWSILSTKKRRIFGLVKNYSYGPDKNKAHHFLIQSSSAIDIEKIFWLKNTSNDGYRLLIDLKKTTPNPKTTIIQKKAPKQIDPVIAKETAPIPKVATPVKDDLAEIEDLLAILKPQQENISTIS
ncbi:MAG: hypothetical protein Q8K37_01105, partial [Alphaproteobacteria bacterium]|nr:hypothetical protein [Alphaproteobacteria bacterium]